MPKEMDITYYQDFELVGTGNFSEIYSCVCKYRKQKFALKKFLKSRLKQLNKEADVRMEVIKFNSIK